MKSVFITLFMMLCLGIGGGLYAQTDGHKPRLVDARIDLKATQVLGSRVVIEYVLPYSGMVEIRLFDKEGRKIWQNQYPDQFGENRIILKASKFNPGETYTYALNYKRDEVKEKIIVPPIGYD